MLTVYVDGPFDNPVAVRNAVVMAATMWDDAIVGVLPQVAWCQQMLCPRFAADWDQVNTELASRCDAILRLPESDGTISPDGVLVFTSYKSLLKFAREGLEDGRE